MVLGDTLSGRKELEIKLAVRDPNSARKVLTSRGFVHEDTCLEVDIYYKHPCRDFMETDEAFRFRKRACKNSILYTVTYKGPREFLGKGVKSREELEVNVDEHTWRNLMFIVERLGFQPILEFAKKREFYRGSGLKATIDALLGVGYFIELELEGASKADELFTILESLDKSAGISVVEKTYLEICLETGSCSALAD